MNREDIIRVAKAYAWMREGEKESEDFLVDFFNAAYAIGANAERKAYTYACERIDALVAEIDAIPREGEVDYDGIFMIERDDGEYLSFDAVKAITDKYRGQK